MIREKFETHKQAIYLLSEGQEAMKKNLPVGSNSGINFANSTAADKLKHLMEEVNINNLICLEHLCYKNDVCIGGSIKK